MFQINLTKLWLDEGESFAEMRVKQRVYGDLEVKVNGVMVPGIAQVQESKCSLGRWSRGLIELRELEEFATSWDVTDRDPAFRKWTFNVPASDPSSVLLSVAFLPEGEDVDGFQNVRLGRAEVVQASKAFRLDLQKLLLECVEERIAHRWYLSATNRRWNRE